MSEHVLERLSAYLDGELPRDEQAVVHEHLGACADCALRLEELAALDAAARALPVAAPAGYFEALPARLRARLEPQRRVPRLPVWGLAAAAAVALAVLTPAVLRRTRSPADAPVQQQEPSAAAPRERNAGRAAPPMAEPAAPAPAAVRPMATLAVPREKAGAAAPTEATRRRQETALGAVTAPMATAPPPAPAPRAPAHGALEQSQVREEKADEADAPREAATDLQAARKQAVAEGEERRTAAASELRANPPAADSRYARLLAHGSPGDADQARELRDAWRAFARDHPAHAGADEARVRALEAGAQVYLFSLDPRDLDRVRGDAAAYLARPDAAQLERVRALLQTLEQ